MATVVVTVTSNRFAEIAARLPRETGEVVEETIHRIETGVKTGMAGPHSGRMYGSHQASAPGEMPAVDTSNLINTIQATMDGETEGAVWTSAEYAPHLEYGTVNMEARPFFTPAAEAERQGFVIRMQNLEDRLG